MFSDALRAFTGRTRNPLDDFWYRPARSASVAGVKVDDVAALNVSTFFACLRILSDTIGSLPWIVYRSNNDEDRERDKEHPYYHTLHDRPNQWQTAIDWRAMVVGHLILRGNFYARIDPADGFWRQSPSLVPLNPDRMEIKQTDSTRLRYIYRYQTGGEADYSQEEILHIKLLSVDGVYGLAPLEYARETLGLSLAQQRHSQSLFSGGGFIKYYLKTTKRLGKDGMANFRKGWRDLHGDPSNFQPPILENDMDIQTLGMTNKDAEWLEGRKHGAYETCQFLGVPPHLVFLLDRATFSNIEHQGIEWSTIHLNPWLIRMEQGVQGLLGREHFSEFNRDALVRGDIKSRYEAYASALGGRSFVTTNEVRKRENLPPLEGGDELLEPMNMSPVGQVPSQEPESDAVTHLLGPIIDDAADRIVRREVQGIGARASKASKDREEFNEWAAGWYGKHALYMMETLEPLHEVTGGGLRLSLLAFCQQYCQEILGEITASDNVPQALSQREATGADHLASLIKEKVVCTSRS